MSGQCETCVQNNLYQETTHMEKAYEATQLLLKKVIPWSGIPITAESGSRAVFVSPVAKMLKKI